MFKEIPILLENRDIINEFESMGIKPSEDAEAISMSFIDLLDVSFFFDNMDNLTTIYFKSGQSIVADMPYKNFKDLMKDNGMFR